MDQAPGLLIANQHIARSRPVPRLRLLVEWEPRHRVFLGNLADLLGSRRVAPLRLTSRPAPFWNDVFVPSGAPWSSFLESMLWHLLVVILLVWAQSRVWEPVRLLPQRDAFHRPITYYPPTPSFRAADSRAPTIRARSRVKQTPVKQPAKQSAIPVRPEQRQRPSLVTPPDIKQATASLPDLSGSPAVTPMVPFSATAGPRHEALAGPSGVVAPPPQIDKATARRLALPQASAVASAPELGPSAGRGMNTPNAGGLPVVPPPPSVQTAGDTRAGRVASLSGTNIVHPPPSVQSAGTAAGDARLRSMAGAGSQVVPPSPSVQNAGPARAGRVASLSGTSIVPPPPSVQGTGTATGNSRLASMAASSQVVPPPPSVQASGGPAGGARLNPLSSARSDVVPPPPSVQNGGNSGADARLGALSRNGSAEVPSITPPAATLAAAGGPGGGTGKVLEPMDPLPAGAGSDPSAANNADPPNAEELPLGLLGVVFEAPGSSFFSNFEVFVAKRRVGKDQLQLIKLVYEFLPYQRRLSEYDLNNQRQRIIKLRVIPDPSCDETLGQVVQSHTDPNLPATEAPKLPAALRSYDMNALLPCYRTTASDFQKAMSQSH